jgi:hypothetical protein
MPVYKIKSPVVLFNHAEYGERILFRHGVVNSRNELGKNGISLHRSMGALFYNTVTIEANLINKNGTQDNQRFILNRSSLIKYLGKNTRSCGQLIHHTIKIKQEANFMASRK